MAKNKKSDRSQHKTSPAQRGEQQAQTSAIETQAEERISPVTPSDMAQKGRQKRFGHN
ncbi:hypothetical protein QWM81_24225 [Streptomyces ficellus]|uniref:Small hydrophilic protein n=1 Tax=Streptomyces ficellus TaxID=1977088 RepID=A0ABT7ZC58_9ACTN|nr:hypothetical protein [Streptomyces ficellus]MDN3297095.1 hypothetical protein [Streptomyces ficellus]